jgi:hypothetical protein
LKSRPPNENSFERTAWSALPLMPSARAPRRMNRSVIAWSAALYGSENGIDASAWNAWAHPSTSASVAAGSLYSKIRLAFTGNGPSMTENTKLPSPALP